MNALKPYIGISACTTEEHVEDVVQQFEANGLHEGKSHTGMVGFLVNGKPTLDPRFENRVVSPDSMINLAHMVRGQLLPMTHIEIEDEKPFIEPFEDVFAAAYEQAACKAVQLNGVPHVESLENIRRRYPELIVTFQIRPELYSESPSDIARIIKTRYEELINYILIDPSCGRGAEFDIDKSVQVFNEIRRVLPGKIPGFAGGYSPENVSERTAVLKEKTGNTHWSIDVEGGVRTEDVLDTKRTDAFIADAAENMCS